MKRIDIVTKTNIRKKTECTVFREITTITDENTAMVEKK